MKNIVKISLLSIFMIFSSCDKENVSENIVNESSREGIRFVTNSSENHRTSQVNGLLAFDDIETFLNTIEDLEKEAEDYDNDFLSKWDHLNDDALEAKEIELSHNPNQPMADFESDFSGFVSLRKAIENQLEDLIKFQTLNDSNDPDNHYVMEDAVRTVLNADAQVMIGHSLYQMTRFGYVEITDGDFNTLALIANADATQYTNLPNLVIHGGYYGSNSGNNTQNNAPSCRTDYDETNYKTTSSNRRVKGIQKLKGHSALWGTKIKSKTVHQKKRWWGGWTSQRTWIKAKIEGESVNNSCNQPNEENEFKQGRKHKVIAKISGPSSYAYKTKHQELKTIHFKNGNSNIIDDYFYE